MPALSKSFDLLGYDMVRKNCKPSDLGVVRFQLTQIRKKLCYSDWVISVLITVWCKIKMMRLVKEILDKWSINYTLAKLLPLYHLFLNRTQLSQKTVFLSTFPRKPSDWLLLTATQPTFTSRSG